MAVVPTAPRRLVRSGFVLLLLLQIPGIASGRVSREALEKSRQHYKRGIKLFGDEEYKAALAEFLKSNKLRSHWRSLYNIATCYGRLGSYLTAIRFYNRSISHRPAPPHGRRRDMQREIKRLRSLIGIVRVQLNVARATLIVDGRPRRIRNGATLRLPSGVHVLEARAPGHSPQKRQITVTGGEVSTIQLTLKVGTRIRIEANVTGARILVDGVETGRTPYDADLPPGRHTVRVLGVGRLPWEGAVTGKSGSTLRVDVELDDPKKGLKQYWFWSCAAVAVAMGAAALGLGLKVKSDQKDYDQVVRSIQDWTYVDPSSGEQLASLQAEGRRLQDDLRRNSLGTNLALGFAAAVTISAVTLAFFTRFRKPGSRASITLALQPGGGAGVLAAGRF